MDDLLDGLNRPVPARHTLSVVALSPEMRWQGVYRRSNNGSRIEFMHIHLEVSADEEFTTHFGGIAFERS